MPPDPVQSLLVHPWVPIYGVVFIIGFESSIIGFLVRGTDELTATFTLQKRSFRQNDMDRLEAATTFQRAFAEHPLGTQSIHLTIGIPSANFLMTALIDAFFISSEPLLAFVDDRLFRVLIKNLP
jgi:hypothetical protein